MCSILRVLSLQWGASVVTKDDSLPVSTIAVVFLLSVETPLVQPTRVALQPLSRRTCLSKITQELVMACFMIATSMLYCFHL